MASEKLGICFISTRSPSKAIVSDQCQIDRQPNVIIKLLRGTKSYPPPKYATDGKPGIHISVA